MEQQGWFFARLDQDQLSMLRHAERTLGSETDVLLAYQEVRTTAEMPEVTDNGLRVAPLNDSQVECLQGLEKKLGTLVIAYQQAG